MCGPPHTAPLDSQRASIPPSGVVGLAILQLPCQRLESPPGRQTGSREGGERWDLWERRRLAHPGGRGQRPPAHRKPGCSCRTVAWTWRGWTLHSGSKTCSDKGKSGQLRGRPRPAVCVCPGSGRQPLHPAAPSPTQPAASPQALALLLLTSEVAGSSHRGPVGAQQQLFLQPHRRHLANCSHKEGPPPGPPRTLKDP